jgi:hypothetical protein
VEQPEIKIRVKNLLPENETREFPLNVDGKIDNKELIKTFYHE